jgi:hypothetical protein
MRGSSQEEFKKYMKIMSDKLDVFRNDLLMISCVFVIYPSKDRGTIAGSDVRELKK